MLFILTAPTQTGKTRWLKRMLRHVEDNNVICIGVIAPGDWRELPDGTFEKLGIHNELLPDHRCIPFARRRDLALEEGTYSSTSQSARAHLLWEISDSAIDEVNAHFNKLMENEQSLSLPTLLVIDEFGSLEMEREGGLTEAVRMVERGPYQNIQHALIVARPDMAPLVKDRFGDIWGGTECIAPHEAGWNAVVGTLCQPVPETACYF